MTATAPTREARATLALVSELLRDYGRADAAVRLWDGTVWGSPEPRFTLVLEHPGALRAMLGSTRRLQLALAEAYVNGDYDVEGDLEAVLPLADHLLVERPLRARERVSLARRLLALPDGSRRNGVAPVEPRGSRFSLNRARQAVAYHYDFHPDFYGLFLDRRRVYTCAYFRTSEDDLDTAQEQKLDYACRKLRLRPGERLLDVGCGWGGLVMWAAERYGVEALGITLSEPQAELANERIRAAGLERRCRVEVVDYRELRPAEPFDKVASIGMFEHLALEQLPGYFRDVWRLTRPGGVFLNHGIAEPPTVRRRRGGSFTMAYLFPDCELVPVSSTLRAAEQAGWEVRDVESLREHYALTVDHWRRRLEAAQERAVELVGEQVYRIWRLGMSGFAYGQKVGRINLYQSLLVKPDGGRSGLPLTREDWYA